MAERPGQSRTPAAWDLDDSDIRLIVGDLVAERGLVYAQKGAVSELRSEVVGRGRRLTATVTGSGPRPYRVTISEGPGVWAALCTCPLGGECKHVAATLYRASRNAPAPRPEWERTLARVLGGVQPEPRLGVSELGLLFDVVQRADTPLATARIGIRPITQNARGNWTKTNMSWSALRYGVYSGLRFHTAQSSLLREISALTAAGASYSYSYAGQDQVSLETFPSSRLWDILDDARAVGIALLTSLNPPTEVQVEPVAPVLSLAVDSTADGWSLTPRVVWNDADIDAMEILLVGNPIHGVAWHNADDDTTLHIARLAQPLDAAVRAVMAMPTTTIPTAQGETFFHDYYADITQLVDVTSPTGSFTPPQQTTRLRLAVTRDSHRQTTLTWSWVDYVGTTERARPFGEGGINPADEAKVAAALAIAGEIPALVHVTPTGRTLLASPAEVSGIEAVRFFTAILPALRDAPEVDIVESGLPVTYDEATDAPVIEASGDADGRDWFDLSISITVRGETVPFEEVFRALAHDATHILLPSGTYFSVDRPEFANLKKLIVEARALRDARTGTFRVNRFDATIWSDLDDIAVLSAGARRWSDGIRKLARAVPEELPAPKELKATLRPYQLVGFNWLAFLYDNGMGGILADDMGLGKTVQTIALFCHAKRSAPADSAPFLVVAPTSVVSNWAWECQRFAPHLRVATISETGARRQHDLADVAAGADVVITSYALFRLEFEAYEAIAWKGLILDEAQAIKNAQSRGNQCARRLDTPFKLAMTGTPMENNLGELWAILSVTSPGLLGDTRNFTEKYRAPIERTGDAPALDALRARIRPLLLRRTKDHVARDLPPKTEQTIDLDLNARHHRVYSQYLQRERQKVLGLLDDVNGNRFEILRSLTLLRQASIDPALVDPKHATVPSTKLDALIERLEEIGADGHRALVFSQFTRFLGRVRTQLDAVGIKYAYLDGTTRNRPRVIDSFKNGDAPVFLISLKAGGVGLNLVEADYCFILDPWWNPAAEAQAVDRAHRIGQTKNVMVYRLVARDTIEEKVMALKAKKQQLFSAVVDGGGATDTTLSASDIRMLLEPAR